MSHTRTRSQLAENIGSASGRRTSTSGSWGGGQMIHKPVRRASSIWSLEAGAASRTALKPRAAMISNGSPLWSRARGKKGCPATSRTPRLRPEAGSRWPPWAAAGGRVAAEGRAAAGGMAPRGEVQARGPLGGAAEGGAAGAWAGSDGSSAAAWMMAPGSAGSTVAATGTTAPRGSSTAAGAATATAPVGTIPSISRSSIETS